MARPDSARIPAADAAGIVTQRLADGLARRGGPVRRRAVGGLRELGAVNRAVYSAVAATPTPSLDEKEGEPACRPGSVRPLARGGGHPSGTAVAGSLVRPTREHRTGCPQALAQGTAGSPLGLAPGGVYRAVAVTCGAGGLLHHRFTLTPANAGAVCFLWHFPAGHPGSALPTTMPCGARTFLTGLTPGATARPTHPRLGYAEGKLAGVIEPSRRPRTTRATPGRLLRVADG